MSNYILKFKPEGVSGLLALTEASFIGSIENSNDIGLWLLGDWGQGTGKYLNWFPYRRIASLVSMEEEVQLKNGMKILVFMEKPEGLFISQESYIGMTDKSLNSTSGVWLLGNQGTILKNSFKIWLNYDRIKRIEAVA